MDDEDEKYVKSIKGRDRFGGLEIHGKVIIKRIIE
jgi:hypothetical protein